MCVEQGDRTQEACQERLLVPLWNVSGGLVGTQKLLLGQYWNQTRGAVSLRELAQVGSMLEQQHGTHNTGRGLGVEFNGPDRKVCSQTTNIG